MNALILCCYISSRSTRQHSVYIGKTKRHYLVCQFEHLGLSVFTKEALRYGDKDATAIRKHCHHQNHVNYTDNFKIMGNSVNN